MARRHPITHRRVTDFQEEQGAGAVRLHVLAVGQAAQAVAHALVVPAYDNVLVVHEGQIVVGLLERDLGTLRALQLDVHVADPPVIDIHRHVEIVDEVLDGDVHDVLDRILAEGNHRVRLVA